MGIVIVCLNRESHRAACSDKFLSYPASVKAERTAAIWVVSPKEWGIGDSSFSSEIHFFISLST